MKLLGTADLHGGLVRYGAPTPGGSNTRVEDFRASLERFTSVASEHRVDIAAFAGDTFNTRREGPLERAIFAAACRRLVDAGICVVIVPGNHDGMTTVGDRDSHALNWLRVLNIPDVHVLTDFEGDVILRTRSGEVAVTSVPYPHKRAFDALLVHLPPEERVLEAGRRLTAALATVGQVRIGAIGEMPRLLVGHLTVGGATVGADASMKLSWDVAIGAEPLALWDFALLGHIHKQQAVLPNAWYAGSPEYLDFSEVGQTKGFLLVDFDPAGANVTVIDSEPRPMVEVELHLVADGTDRYDATLIPSGAIVRAVIHADERPNMARIAVLLSAMKQPGFGGASYVKLHIVTPDRVATQRIAVDPTDTVLEATGRWLTANGHPLEPTMDVARRIVATVGGTG